MMGNNDIKRIEELRKEIIRHNDLYYSEAKPVIADSEYDKLIRELKSLEEQYPLFVTADSPTQKVGAPVRSGFNKVKHTQPMLSLGSIYTEEEAAKFDKTCKKEIETDQIDYVAEPKLDGFSVELVYKNGVLLRGSTRGDGTVGEDVTENLKAVKNIPQKLKGENIPDLLAVRGEVLIHINDFRLLNKRQTESGKDVFANPRNAAAGAVRNLDPRVTAERNLDIYCFRVLESSSGLPFTHIQMLDTMKNYGLKISPDIKLCSDINEVIQYHHDLEAKRDDLDYEMDGVVVKINEVSFQDTLGVRTNNPRWATAYKFEARKEVTRVEDIVVQVGRTGTLTPVALLKPVEVGGVTISRASLHNMDEIDRLGVRIGDYVKVQRAGDVIPKVIEVISEKRTGKEISFNMPEKCPSCNTPLEKEDVFYKCPSGLGCTAQLKEAMTHYTAKDAVDIDGFSEKTVDQLFEEGLIGKISDIYKLKKEDLLKLEGWKQKKTNNILEAIERAKTVTLDRFIFGLGIRNVGKHIASVLARRYGTLEVLMEAEVEGLLEIKEIGPEIAEGVVGFFREINNIDEIKALISAGVNLVGKENTGKLMGKKFVFTGSLTKLSRSEAKKLTDENGAETLSSVSNDTDFVVAGEKAGSKLEKARQKGVAIISEQDFLEMLK